MGKNVVKLNVVLADVIQGVYERKGERSEMTEQEAIKEIKRWSRILMSAGKECTEVTAEAQDMAVQALEDIQKYRTIGTVEECRTARERQISKKPMYEGDGYDDSGNLIYDTWICPNCGERYEVDYDDYDFCPNCGQRLDWSDAW